MKDFFMNSIYFGIFLTLVSYFCVMVITGHIVQLIIRAKNKKTSKEN